MLERILFNTTPQLLRQLNMPDTAGFTQNAIVSSATIKQRSKRPVLYLIITNISKAANIRCLVRSAVAFGVKSFFIVGQKRFEFRTGSTDLPGILREQPLDMHYFDKMSDCVHYIHNVLSAKICGVEIVDSARDVADKPFEGDTAIMMGNEGTGMSRKQLEACDYFVRIGQYGGGTASLNVYVAASIVMQSFNQWSRASCA